MKFHRIQIFLIFLSSISKTIIKAQHVCAEYSQDFASKNAAGIDASKNPNLVVYSSECKGCIATIKNGIFKANCVQKDSDFGSKLCETPKTFNCEDKICCCHGDFCYDRLRNYFAFNSSKDSTECLVQRKLSTESGISDSSVWRSSCSICVAELRGNAIESRCVESENMVTECSTATELIGGNLACTKDRKKCCCKSDNCQVQFEKLFFEIGNLGKSLLSEPYASESKIAELKNASAGNALYKLNGILFVLYFVIVLLL